MDFVTSGLALLLFNIIRYSFNLNHGIVMPRSLGRFILNPMVISEQFVFPLLMVGIFWLSGYYATAFRSSRLKDLTNAAGCSIAGVLVFFFLALLNDILPMRRLNYELLLIFFALLTLTVTAGRWLLHIKRRRRGAPGRAALIIGTSDAALALAERIRHASKVMDLNITGFVTLPGEEHRPVIDLPVYSLDDVAALVAAHKVKALVIAPDASTASTLGLVRRFLPLDVSVMLPPDSSMPSLARRSFNNVAGEPLVDISNPPMNAGMRNVKRVIDVIVSATALLLLSPVMAATALAVKLDSPGPVFYRQKRVGYHRRPFNILKFRSMRNDAETESGPALSSPDDPRVTRTGRFMRKYRLDELPNFWNVLRGDMSLVGPRPEREYFLAQMMERAPQCALLHRVRPGITSWGMVKFGYAQTVDEMVERLRYDLLYVENVSLTVDVKILFYTVHTVITGKGI